MAPRPQESFEAFVSRLKAALQAGRVEVRFGLHHHSHALCVEDGVFRVRCLSFTKEEADAWFAENGIFMPEHAELISKPRELVFEERALDDLVERLRGGWPSC